MADEVSLEVLGELIIRVRDEQVAQRERLEGIAGMLDTVVRMLRRIEDRMDRQDELVLSLLQSDRDLERRLRAVERAHQDREH